MRSIQRRFENVQAKASGLSSYILFARAISGQGFGRDDIGRWFNKLVDANDYAKQDKKRILEYLVNLSKVPEEHRI